MSWMDALTSEQRAFMLDVNVHRAHSRTRPAGTKVYRDGQWRDHEGPGIRNHSMFPYRSTSMAVDPSEVEQVQEDLRRKGVFVDFDAAGRPEITSTKQHGELAKALGMKTGRDGYGHTDQYGNFQNSGRRRNDEVQEGRGRIRQAIQELNSMPEDAPAHAVHGVLDEYDISPTGENTG